MLINSTLNSWIETRCLDHKRGECKVKITRNITKESAQVGIVNQVLNDLKEHKSIVLKIEHLIPEVLIDTPQRYLARYIDKYGEYDFEITKLINGWTVISSNLKVGTFQDADYIKWNFETQLKKYAPRVLAQV